MKTHTEFCTPKLPDPEPTVHSLIVSILLQALQHNVEAMNEALMKWDLKVNWRKTKVMRVARNREECQVVVGKEQLEQVDTEVPRSDD